MVAVSAAGVRSRFRADATPSAPSSAFTSGSCAANPPIYAKKSSSETAGSAPIAESTPTPRPESSAFRGERAARPSCCIGGFARVRVSLSGTPTTSSRSSRVAASATSPISVLSACVVIAPSLPGSGNAFKCW